MSQVLHMISIARKAGKLEVGEEPAGAAARAHQAKLLIIAKDAAENTYRRVRHFAAAGNTTWVSVPYTKSELGGAIGRTSCALMAVMDMGIAAAIVRGLAADDPEKFTTTMEKMNEKAEKALRRQKEKRQHEKNLKTGKYQHKMAAKAAEEAREARKSEGAKKPESGDFEPRKAYSGSYKSGGRKPNGGYHKSGSANRSYKKKSGRSNRYEEMARQKSGQQRPNGAGGKKTPGKRQG